LVSLAPREQVFFIDANEVQKGTFEGKKKRRENYKDGKT
jgi:hypothetical protein